MNISADNGSVAAGVISGSIVINNDLPAGTSNCDVQLANTGLYPDNCEIHTVTLGSHIKVNNSYITMATCCIIEGNNNRVKFGSNINFIGENNTIHYGY